MDWFTPAFLWFIVGVLVLGIELLTLSFYLLWVALGFFVGGFMSVLGADLTWQLVTSAVVMIVGSIVARQVKLRQPGTQMIDWDLGQTVEVTALNPDGTATVMYRGAPWKARAKHGELTLGVWRIAKVDGTQLLLH